jgi:hypothetical protein
MNVENKILSDFIVFEKYAKYNKELKRRETWEELCDRNKELHIKNFPTLVDEINKLYDEGHQIIYYTARGAVTKVDYSELTKKQLNDWGCKHHMLRMNHKPNYDLFICDKSKRIEEI